MQYCVKIQLLKAVSLLLILICQRTEIHAQEFVKKFSFPGYINIKYQVDSIDSAEFFNFKKTGIEILHPSQNFFNWDSVYAAWEEQRRLNKIYMDSVFKELYTNYPKAFELKDSCLFLFAKDTLQKICMNFSENHSAEGYSFEKYQHNCLIIEHGGYEWGEYLIFNPAEGRLKTVENIPVFINDSIVTSAGNYYSEGSFEILNMKDNSRFAFVTFDHELLESFLKETTFYFAFRPNKKHKSSNEYYKIKIMKLL